MPTEKELEKREAELKEQLGYHPAFVGSAALAGGEALGKVHPVSLLSQLLYRATEGGRPIPEDMYGLEVDDLLGRLGAGFTSKEMGAIKKMRKAKGLQRVPIVAGPEAQAMPIDLDDIRLAGRTLVEGSPRYVMLRSTSVPVAMHELGHVTPVLRGKVPGLNKAWHLGGSLAASPLVRWPLMAQVLAPPGDDAGPVRRFAYEHAPELVAASYAPTLLEEMRASGHALHGAHKYGPGALRAAKELAPAFGTYLATGLLPPILATLLGKKLIQHLYKKDKEEMPEKQASGLRAMVKMYHVKQAMAAQPVKPSGALRNSLSVAYTAKPPRPDSTPVKGLRGTKPHQTGVKGRMPISEDRRFHNDMRLSTMGRGTRMGVPSIGR